MKLEIFRSDDNQNPVLVKEFENVARPGTWEWTWDGKLDDGSTAPRGIYLYRLSAYVYGSAPPDRDSNRSDYLFAERAYDENNEPLLYAEYWGYDDKGTPEDETDDAHLYFIRWYVLRDSLDTNASGGTIRLYDPELNPVYSWDITALRCLEHNEAMDGLRASAGGIKHGVIVPVPVSVMGKGGIYRFLIHLVDDHAGKEKANHRKPTRPRNAVYNLIPIVYIQEGSYHIAWCRREVMETVLRLGKIVQSYAAINWAAGVANSEVRAAINGGFFNPNVS
ncbi:hypothetical protein HRbin16_01623 [bacterium HR16]|nr:hypothetical protein HRbin16_01623 [bacterium HR16]